jgi:hypothetical protein
VLTFRLAVVHSLPSAIRLEEAIVPDRFWSLAEPCVEPAPPTNPNAILSAIATALIRLVVMEHVSGIGIWRMGLRDPRFKRQNTLGTWRPMQESLPASESPRYVPDTSHVTRPPFGEGSR